jgi:hypothetical protein
MGNSASSLGVCVESRLRVQLANLIIILVVIVILVIVVMFL